MKGLVLLFISITVLGIAWGYMPTATKSTVKAVVKENLFPIVIAIVAVAIAIFVSTNTTLRLV